jgi:type VI secretion system protein ImpJ
LQVQVTRAGGFSLETLRGLQFEQLMRLRTLNRFGGRLPALAEAASVAPFTLYLELRELLGELTALYPERNEFEVAAYNHDNPILCFRELSTKIRSYLRGAVAPSFIKVPFVKGDDGVLAATLTDEHFTVPNDYFLGIKTKEDPRALSAFVEDADGFKFMPKSLASRAIWGVRLKEERFQPLELPAQSDLHYYRLLRGESQRVWQQMQTEKSAVIRWVGKEDADYDIALYMTVSPDKAR